MEFQDTLHTILFITTISPFNFDQFMNKIVMKRKNDDSRQSIIFTFNSIEYKFTLYLFIINHISFVTVSSTSHLIS